MVRLNILSFICRIGHILVYVFSSFYINFANTIYEVRRFAKKHSKSLDLMTEVFQTTFRIPSDLSLYHSYYHKFLSFEVRNHAKVPHLNAHMLWLHFSK